MPTSLRTHLSRWLGTRSRPQTAEESVHGRAVPELVHAEADEATSNTPVEQPPAHAHAYDATLLERARTQWQFGDWNSLATIDRDTLQYHPDRAKLALLAAAGRLQTDRRDEARHYLRLAQDWGISKKLISQILIAGVHNSIARAASIGGQRQRALKHFDQAITIGTPGSDRRLITQARINEQHKQLGLPTLTHVVIHNSRHSASSRSACMVAAASMTRCKPSQMVLTP
ncbi:hypothetical protein MXC99_01490, partial [Thauera aromatica]|uniref:hypothetical protein n=1 Tax=Thauera aromatica TaxID=59405 RepID=UPI001FFC3479